MGRERRHRAGGHQLHRAARGDAQVRLARGQAAGAARPLDRRSHSCGGRPVLNRRHAMKSIVAALLLGALLASPAAAQPRAKLKFVMPTPPATYLLPYFVAQDLGWYRNWGLEVAEQVISGDPNSLRVVVAGDSEVTLIGPPTIMEAVINGAKLRMFTSWQPVTDYMLIAGDKKAMTLKDLADKRIAVTGPGSMTMHIPQMLMLKAGVDTSQVKFLSVGGMAARLQSVAAGKVDATLVDTFFATKAERSGVAHTVSSIAKEFPGLGYVFAVARENT